MRAAALALAVLVSIPLAARADVVSDDGCHAWEHWEGAHSGECRFGPRCSVTAPGRGPGPSSAALAVGFALLVGRGRRRP